MSRPVSPLPTTGHTGFSQLVVCTAETPWDRISRAGQRVRHVDAVEVGDQQDGYPGGDIARYRCPHCGHTWTAELPQ